MKIKLPGPSPRAVRIGIVILIGIAIVGDIYLAIDGVKRNTITQATHDRALYAPFIVTFFVGMMAFWLPPHLFGGKDFNWKWGVGLLAGALFGGAMLIFLPF